LADENPKIMGCRREPVRNPDRLLGHNRERGRYVCIRADQAVQLKLRASFAFHSTIDLTAATSMIPVVRLLD
jgi:hypothetical protein